VENEITEMRIATWNICRLYRPGAMNELVKEMDKFELDICALQDGHRKEL
jgi:hypothetical protein